MDGRKQGEENVRKELPNENYRVEVTPSSGGFFRNSRTPEQRAIEDKSTCEEIMVQIRRHCDNVNDLVIISDKNVICGHCGYPWDDSSTGNAFYNGGCCQADIDEAIASGYADAEGSRIKPTETAK